MADFRANLAKNIRKLRGESTQIVFAKKIGVDQGTLNRIEQGQQNITLDTLQKICERLKCSSADLLRGWAIRLI